MTIRTNSSFRLSESGEGDANTNEEDEDIITMVMREGKCTNNDASLIDDKNGVASREMSLHFSRTLTGLRKGLFLTRK